MNRSLSVAITLGALLTVSSAASLNLSYNETPVGPLWQYTMTLSVDQSQSAWAPGMGWSWIIFGDVPNNGTSPLADFAVTSGFPVGPFGSLSGSSGGHDGPTFLLDSSNNVTYWVPTSANDTLTWTGTSSFQAVGAGALQFSELLTTGGATADNFKDMTPAPEPATLLVLGGLLPVLARRRKSRR